MILLKLSQNLRWIWVPYLCSNLHVFLTSYYQFVFVVFQHELLKQLLRLAHNCLTFDFIGTSTDESSDDLCTVQIPTSWRPAFLEFSTLQLFFDLYTGELLYTVQSTVNRNVKSELAIVLRITVLRFDIFAYYWLS